MLNDQKKLTPILLVLIIAMAVSIGIFVWQKSKKSDYVHSHAGFKVYIDGKLQDYSDFQYMSESPCVISDLKNHTFNSAELHDLVGDVVHIHEAGAKWKDLFTTIGVTFPPEKPIKGFVKGKEVQHILNQEIKSQESVIVTVGSTSNVNINSYVSLNHIKAIEAASEMCHK